MLSVFITVWCGPISAASGITYSDVPEGYWGYETIMAMTEAGIFKGTREPVNGVGEFSPEKKMTRAEFVTAAVRAMYPTQAKNIKNDTRTWWTGYYFFAMEKGILKYHELDSGKLDQTITREEMAMIMVRCVEKNGEKLTQRIKTTKIPDYAKIGDYYKSYVLDCFSYGLLCGVDELGTFLPSESLNRASAATVLCRLVDKDMRQKVDFSEETTGGNNNDSPSGSGNSGTTTPGWTPGNPNMGGSLFPTLPGQSGQGILPWEMWGAKQPWQYTWIEFLALSSAHKEAFIASFWSIEAFNNWMKNAQGGQNNNKLPWEVLGAKQPSQYTWAEFEALSGAHKEAFIASFGSTAAFNNWKEKAQEAENAKKLPWEIAGAKQPPQYTWTEFEALSAAHKEAFIATFGGGDAFNVWMKKAQEMQGNDKYPWEIEGAKKPSQYTWAEFEDLPESLREAFIAAFGSADAFNTWKTNAQGAQNNQYPWEIAGAKQPSQYTWAEYMALPGEHQMAFQNSFGSTEAFDAWMTKAQGGGNTGKLPWELPGAKQPSQYTYAEYMALPGEQQLAFQNSFGSTEEFNAWLYKVQGGENAGKLPWELPGAKQPAQYTYAEFLALPGEQQLAFQSSFGSVEAFDAWLQKAQNGGTDAGKLPWELPGAKQPAQYTYAEFNALTGEQQMAFQSSFGSPEAFDVWLQKAQSGGTTGGGYPWEAPGAKQPSQYTYAEFLALPGELQMAFQSSFGSVEAFDAWLQRVNP
ncbi:MAG: S-layer homology domain-containing protein [Clostridia bacterium]|nr:S-layer homology domain-containing protein [Clostridia bacterium]